MLDRQNTPLVISDEDGVRYSDNYEDEPELDAAVAAADVELSSFVRANHLLLQGTEFARRWGPPDFPSG